MESLSCMNVDTPSESSSRYDRGFAGSIPPVQTTSQLRCNTTCRKNSKVRLNDQLVPKPTDINIGEKLLIPPPKQHPYLSHMSRFAVFPSFCSPDDPHTGVRAASGPFLQPGIPSSAPHVTVLSKTIGAPHRHEILESPMKTRKKSVRWPEEHVFLDPTERKQVFYPTPPKAVLPNAALRDWELSLPERTSNMLKNLERALWLTSYQSHYTGSGPANPLQIDDFKEKMSGPAGMNPHSAPLRERSRPTFVASKPVQARRRTGSGSEPLSPSPGIIAKLNEEPHLNPMGTEAGHTELSHEHNRSVCESGFTSNVLPRPPGPPGARRPHGAGTVAREGAALSLLELQNSFSRSEAHRSFNGSVTRAAVDLRDNVVAGRKHSFYGVNCCYLRG